MWLCSYSLNFKQPYYRLSTDRNWIPLFNQWEIAVMPSFLFHNHCHAHWCARRPRPSNIRKRGLQVQSSTGYSRVSIQSWDRCFSDGASGNLVHRNCDRAGDSSCCNTTRCSGVSRGGSMGSMEPPLLKGCLGKYYAQTCARTLVTPFTNSSLRLGMAMCYISVWDRALISPRLRG